MEFNPNNPIVKLCLQGMFMEDQGKPEEAKGLFVQAWGEASNKFEKFLAAYYVARHQSGTEDKLQWAKTALQLALELNEEAVKAALPLLYFNLAKCYEEAGDTDNGKKNYELAASVSDSPADEGPFYHGTRANLKAGDFLTPGKISNYQEGLVMNHIYFTALISGAGLAAALAKGDGPERVYIVEPTGSFENDPNVTNKKFPGNPTRSYRTDLPLKIVGEAMDWERTPPEQVKQWREKLKENKGEIVN